MKKDKTALLILAGLVVSTSIVYFYVAYQEYANLMDFIDAGIGGETQEVTIEMSLFIGSAIIYLGLLAWIIKSKQKSITPFICLIVLSVLLIGTYIASRSVGVPFVGVEYYVGKIDILSKILQSLIIITSLYSLIRINRLATKEIKQ